VKSGDFRSDSGELILVGHDERILVIAVRLISDERAVLMSITVLARYDLGVLVTRHK
jgi:hypothetical protein